MVVGQSFQWEVIDPDYDVLMVFYAPWCNYRYEINIVYL